MIKYEIIDNYLSDAAFKQLTNGIMPDGSNAKTPEGKFPWGYMEGAHKSGTVENPSP